MFTSGSYRPLVKVLEGSARSRRRGRRIARDPAGAAEGRRAAVRAHRRRRPRKARTNPGCCCVLRLPRDPVMVADWVSFNVIDTERQDWARGWAQLKTFAEREQHARVPYGHKEGAYPLGQWVAEQRRAYGAGQMTGQRARSGWRSSAWHGTQPTPASKPTSPPRGSTTQQPAIQACGINERQGPGVLPAGRTGPSPARSASDLINSVLANR